MKHWRYFRYMVRHKWYVGVECWGRGLWLHAVTHDLSKFRWSEWFPYVSFFYGPQPPLFRTQLNFDKAWLLHQHRNQHHWQYWLVIDNTFGKWYNASDGGLCQCLNLKKKTRKSALYVGLNVREQISYMAGSLENYVKNIISKQPQNIKPITLMTSEDGIENETLKTQLNTENDKKIFLGDIVGKCWKFMEETRLNVSVVVKLFMNFWLWIISKVMENNGDGKTPKVWEDSKRIAGLLGTDFLPYSGYCATTATHPMDFTGIVPIRSTKILVEDEGKILCLGCNKPFFRERILPFPIPSKVLLQMTCDWIGASKAIRGRDAETSEWYKKVMGGMEGLMHPLTRQEFERQIGYEGEH